MLKTQVIHTGSSDRRWLKLLEYLNNISATTARCSFATDEKAKKALKSIHTGIRNNPSRFRITAWRAGCDVYLVKLDHTRKFVVVDE